MSCLRSRQIRFLLYGKSQFLTHPSCKMERLISNTFKPCVSSYFSSVSCHSYSTIQSRKSTKQDCAMKNPFVNFTSTVYRYLSTDGIGKGQGVVAFTSQPMSNSTFIDESLKTNAATLETSFSGENLNELTGTFGNSSETLLSADLSTAVENIEIPLSSLGLGGWTPVGMIQQFLEVIHVQCGLPWWGSICVATLIIRTLMSPLIIMSQRNAANYSNRMPEMVNLEAKYKKARRSRDDDMAKRYGQELMDYMKKHNTNPLKMLVVPLCQAPVFLSFFWGLRGMAKLPVESLKTGGLFWFPDLTVPDPYFITPLISCATFYVTLKVGAESGVRLENMKLARYLFSALPVVMFPFVIFFPSAVLCYWCTTNLITLFFVSVLKFPAVRHFFNIPDRWPVDSECVVKSKGFIQDFKEALNDQDITTSDEYRRRKSEIRFKEAACGPVQRTYAYDPTKHRPAGVASRKLEGKGFKA